MIHELKIYSAYFEKIISGEKTFEVRKNDRDFRVGDILALNENDYNGACTGRSCAVEVTYILNEPDFVKNGYVIMAIRPCHIQKQSEDICFKDIKRIYEVPVYETRLKFPGKKPTK